MRIGAGERYTLIELRAAIDSVIDKLAQNEMDDLDQVHVNISVCRDACQPSNPSNVTNWPEHSQLIVADHHARAYSFHYWSLDM